jgi:beta-fructofuranosidase
MIMIMMMGLRLLSLAAVVATAAASSSNYYDGPLRPQIHFSPPQKFMNDPNGCFLDANGTWHLYYQCEL